MSAEAFYSDSSLCSLSSRDLKEIPPEIFDTDSSLRELDVSRNRLDKLPSPLFDCLSLTRLDVSRNNLKQLPVEVGKLRCLTELQALSNNIRPKGLPIDELAALPELKLLDLRWNAKLKQEQVQKQLLTSLDPRVTLRITGKSEKKEKLSAADRDASQIQSQLEPLSTPQLRRRLLRTFGILSDPECHGRERVMASLVNCYEKQPREVRFEQGTPVRVALLDEILAAVRATPWPTTTRERPKVAAEGYFILQKPNGEILKPDSPKARLEAAKIDRHRRVWEVAVETIMELDPVFAEKFTALAVTRGFKGSPHIDTLNVAPFYGISVGEYSEDGGQLCVECSATVVAHVDTRGKLAKIDGRFPHWVSPYQGERYSLIYYQTWGEVSPQTTAIFAPTKTACATEGREEDVPDEWIPPEAFELY